MENPAPKPAPFRYVHPWAPGGTAYKAEQVRMNAQARAVLDLIKLKSKD